MDGWTDRKMKMDEQTDRKTDIKNGWMKRMLDNYTDVL